MSRVIHGVIQLLEGEDDVTAYEAASKVVEFIVEKRFEYAKLMQNFRAELNFVIDEATEISSNVWRWSFRASTI